MSHMIRFRSDDSPAAKAALAGGKFELDPDHPRVPAKFDDRNGNM